MKRARLLLGVGIWVALLPHLGFPLIIKNILFLATGLVLIYLALVIYRQINQGSERPAAFENFTENKIEDEENEAE